MALRLLKIAGTDRREGLVMNDSNCVTTSSEGRTSTKEVSATTVGVRNCGEDFLAARGARVTDELVLSMHPALLRIAKGMVGYDDVAQDVVQDTWISALRSIHTYEGRSGLLTWLVGILRRRVVDHRRRTRRVVQEVTESMEGIEWPLSSVVERAEAREQVARLDATMEVLTERERAALMLCEVQGFTREEVAAKLAVSRVHLRVLLHRARYRVRAGADRQLETT
jgi:RNA polymerase sigma-70 factor (ECF subfamily)